MRPEPEDDLAAPPVDAVEESFPEEEFEDRAANPEPERGVEKQRPAARESDRDKDFERPPARTRRQDAEREPEDEPVPETLAQDEPEYYAEEPPPGRPLRPQQPAPRPSSEPPRYHRPPARREERREFRPAEPASVKAAIEDANRIIDSLRSTLDDMEEVLETLELAERQKDADEQEIESLRRALRGLHRPR